MISAQTAFLLSLSMLKGIGPATLRKVASIRNFHQMGIGDLANRVPQVARALLASEAWALACDLAARQMEDALKYESRVISALDPEYPRLLAVTKDDPFLLFVRGRLASDADKSVAVIGTREPTAHGEMIAARITSFFAEQGWSIVSGLAIGCDAIAHSTALKCNAHTVAVLAHGLQIIAPSRHKALAEEIVESGGALVSEYPFGQEIQKQQYVKRDKTQAGLAQGVVMIQSDLVGGSLHASRAALDYGRWLAVPYPTERDLDRGEPKVQANLMIAGGPDHEVAELLRCSDEALGKIVVLKSKEDYARLLSPVKGVGRKRFHDTEAHGYIEPSPSIASDLNANFLAASSMDLLAAHPTTTLIEQLLARQKYIVSKLREIDAFLDCLAEASPEAKWELQFELENVLAHMLVFVVEAEGGLRSNGSLHLHLKASASKLAQDLSSLRNKIVHGVDVIPQSLKTESATLHIAGSAQVRQIRAEFQDFSLPAMQLLGSP